MEVIKAFMKTKENGKNIYKMLNAWLRNFRSILVFMKKEIKDTKRERPEGKYFEISGAVFKSISMNNKGPSHTSRGRTFFFFAFAKKWPDNLKFDSLSLTRISCNKLW